ncbi:MAG: hypothetical protein K6F28_08885 [Lachnospiraceae bacterium]|nr:hypothetical protein [Lachnospiraceae bacterium]
MYKDIITCSSCSHFFINSEGVSMCDNPRGLPFPSTADYCSGAEKSDKDRTVDNSELLKLVYEQRRSGK